MTYQEQDGRVSRTVTFPPAAVDLIICCGLKVCYSEYDTADYLAKTYPTLRSVTAKELHDFLKGIKDKDDEISHYWLNRQGPNLVAEVKEVLKPMRDYARVEGLDLTWFNGGSSIPALPKIVVTSHFSPMGSGPS